MSRHPHRHGRRTLGVLLHRWHRRIGLCAALFLIWLAVSGIALNEAPLLRLDERRIDSPWLMRVYGLGGDPHPSGFESGGHWLISLPGRTQVDGREVQPAIEAPLGMVLLDGVLYIATADSLVLLKPQDGARIDVLRTPPLPPPPFKRIGLLADRLTIDDGSRWTSSDGEAWLALDRDGVSWSEPKPLPQNLINAVAIRPSLPASRVLADLHSGRIFGAWGARVVDAVAIAALLLAISGVWAALRRRRH